MADLFTIGEETFTDERWIIVAMPSYRRTHRLKKYILANGKPKAVHEGRDPIVRTFSVRYIPSQNFATGGLWDRRSWPTGTNWLTELQRLENVGADGMPQAVTIGEVDYGEWFVDVRTTPDPETNIKNPREGTMAPLITTAEITLTEVDEEVTALTNNASGATQAVDPLIDLLGVV